MISFRPVMASLGMFVVLVVEMAAGVCGAPKPRAQAPLVQSLHKLPGQLSQAVGQQQSYVSGEVPHVVLHCAAGAGVGELQQQVIPLVGAGVGEVGA